MLLSPTILSKAWDPSKISIFSSIKMLSPNTEKWRLYEVGLLTGSVKKSQIRFDIEHIRFFGLLGISISVWIGNFVTRFLEQFFVTDEPKNSPWEILMGKAESNFHEEEPYIYYLFHTHNPAKTQVATVPLAIFAFLHYRRVNLQEGPEWEYLKSWSKTLLVWEVICFAQYFVCLVNFPMLEIELFCSDRALRDFPLYYFKFSYIFFQSALIVMALEQVIFLTITDKKPFRFMTNGFLRAYFCIMICLFIVYVLFLWTHIIFGPGKGLWDAKTPLGQMCAYVVLYGFDMVAMIIPAICAFTNVENVKPMTIEFSMQ